MRSLSTKNFPAILTAALISILPACACAQSADTLFNRLIREAEHLTAISDRDELQKTATRLQELASEHPGNTYKPWADFYSADGLMRTNLQEAKSYADAALTGFIRIGDREMEARSRGVKGNILANLGEQEEALKLLDESLAYWLTRDTSEAGVQKNLAKLHMNIGFIHTRLGEVEQGSDHLFSAERFSRQLRDTVLTSAILTHIGNAFFIAEDYQNSFKYYRKAYNLARATDNPAVIRPTLSGIGNTFFKLHQLDSALAYQLQVYDLVKKTNDQVAAAVALTNLTGIYGEMKNLPKALALLEELRELAEKNGLTMHLANAYINMAGCAAEAGAFDKALDLNQKGLDLALSIGDLNLQEGFYYSNFQIHEAKGDYRSALRSYLKYDQLKDSLKDEKVLARINEWETRYETAQKEAKIAALNEENRIQALELRQKTTLLAALGLIGLLLFAAVFLYNRQRVLRSQKKAIELEQRLLGAQMNPHFTFNALSSIQSFLLNQGQAERGAFYLTKFARLIRQTLEHSRRELIPLSEETESLNNYLAIQQLRYENRFDFRIEMDEGLDPDEIFIPPMLIQPFVENAIEHGRIYTRSGGNVNIRFEQRRDHYQVVISDNGIGRTAARQLNGRKDGSLATLITRERCSLLTRTYRKAFRYDTEDGAEGGTRVVLVLPKLKERRFGNPAMQTA
ncbi:MAG: tetratricopeptide repeat protein [Lewinella sp.]|nr:tetratricopeptide repeat protein [Lewinella sp.]